MSSFNESIVEDPAPTWLKSLGYAVLHGPDIVPDTLGAECRAPNYRDVVLERDRAAHQCPWQSKFTIGAHE